jgi:hypothetical protein
MVRLLDADHQARRLLGFDFDPPARRPGQTIEIAATNLRLVAAALLAALVVRGRPQLRRPLDATLAALLALNTATLGVALGAYGPRLVGALAPHAPLELAAFSLGGGVYLAARGAHISTGALIAVAAVAVTLVAAGAIVETYVRIGAAP